MRLLRQLQFIVFGLLGAVLFFGTVNNVLAMGTPDGQTPSEETVCDGLSGGAFGLCNAYCEAMDCDNEDPGHDADQKACDAIALKLFEKHDVDIVADGCGFNDGECPVPGVCPCPSINPIRLGIIYGTAGFCSGDESPAAPCPVDVASGTTDCEVRLEPQVSALNFRVEDGFQGCTVIDQQGNFVEIVLAADFGPGDYEACASAINAYCTEVAP